MKYYVTALLSAFVLSAFGQLNINNSGGTYSITFDGTVSGVSNGVYDATGFTPTPGAGQLDSDAWKYTGMSDGSLSFGGSATTGDAGRNQSGGGVATGGFYAFNTAALGSSNYSLGWQATDADFTGGTVTLRLQNNTGDTINVLQMAYEAKSYNDQNNGSEITVSYSYDDMNYHQIDELTYASDSAAQGSPTWQSQAKLTLIDTLNWVPDDTLFFQWSSNDITPGATGERDEMAIDDIVFQGYDVDYLWDGSAWSPSEPSGLGAATSNALVLEGDTAVISTSTSLKSLIVNPNGKLKVDVDLDVVDSAVFEADGSGYAQVIGEITGTSIYEYYLLSDSARWFNMAFPVAGTIDSISGIPIQATGNANNTNIWTYNAGVDSDNNGEGDFEPVPNTNFNIERIGFQVYAGDGTYFGSAPFTVRAKGTLLDGPQSISVSAATDSNFNVIPNPYPSTLNWEKVVNDNSDLMATYYIQDGSVNDTFYNYRGYNASIGGGAGGINGGSRFLPPGQSFFVQVTNSTDGTLDFDNSQRNVSGNGNIYRSAPKYNFIKLFTRHTGNDLEDQTFVMFHSSFTDNIDVPVDAGKLQNGGYPNLYTNLNHKNYLFNGISDTFSSRTVSLFFQGDIAGQYKLGIDNEYLPSGWTVELEDKLTGQKVDLRQGDYHFSHSTNNSVQRFALHFSKPSVGGETFKEQKDEIYSYMDNGNLKLDLGEVTEAEIRVYDTSGKLISEYRAQSSNIEMQSNHWSSGFYMVEVWKNGSSIHSNKIIKN